MIGGANRWTDFVKKWASDNDTSYGCALSKPECSQAYRAKYGNRKKLSQKKERELMGAEDKDAPAPPEPDYGDDGGDEGPPPPKKKGRPKKYETEAEAKRAKSQKTMEAKKRRDAEKKASKGEAKEAEAMGAEDKDAPVRYLAEIKRLAKMGPSARPRVKELSVVFNSGGMNEKEMDAFEALAQQFKKPMAPPSGPPPISAEKVAQVKEQMSPARKAQQKRDLMKALRDKRKAEGLSSSGKTLMNPQQMALNKAIVAEGEGIEPIRLEMMEIAEPTVSTKISPNITIAKPRKLKAPKPQKKTGSGLKGGANEDEGETDTEDNSDDEENLLNLPHFWNGQEWVPIVPPAINGLEDDDILVGGKKKGFLDFITKVGTTLGKPFKKEVGINPFTAGFDLGEKVIAPALMKVIPPRGGMMPAGAPPPPPPPGGPGPKVYHTPGLMEMIEEYIRPPPEPPQNLKQGPKGRKTYKGGCETFPIADHLEKEMRNYLNIAQHLGQHLSEPGPKDPKDKLGYIHFSKEAKRIKDLIADRV